MSQPHWPTSPRAAGSRLCTGRPLGRFFISPAPRLASSGTITPACPELRRDCALGFLLGHAINSLNLGLPHPSRFLRRVGSYALTPQPLFTLLVVSLESLDFDRLPLKTPAATFPSNLRTCSSRFAKEGRTKKPYHILAPPRNSATSHPPAGHPACPPREGAQRRDFFSSRHLVARRVFLHSVIPTGANRLFLPRGFCAPVRGVEGSWQDRGWLRCRFCVRLLCWRMPGSWVPLPSANLCVLSPSTLSFFPLCPLCSSLCLP